VRKLKAQGHIRLNGIFGDVVDASFVTSFGQRAFSSFTNVMSQKQSHATMKPNDVSNINTAAEYQS